VGCTWAKPEVISWSAEDVRGLGLDPAQLSDVAGTGRRRSPPAQGGARRPVPLSSGQIRPQGCSLTWNEGATATRLHMPGDPPPWAPGERKPCQGFSGKSRRRLLVWLNSINQRTAPASEWRMVLLTYPKEFPAARASKRDLAAMVRRFKRQYGDRPFFWKLEPQQRGAPHFHLLVWMGGHYPADDRELLWWANTWHEVAGGGDENHLHFHLGMLPGSQPCVQQVRTWNGITTYAGKYLGKLCGEAEGSSWHEPGRFWGIVNRDRLAAVITPVTVDLEPQEAIRARRLMRRWYEHQPTGKSVIVVKRLNGHRQKTRTWRKHFNLAGEGRVTPAELAAELGGLCHQVRRRWRWSNGGMTIFAGERLSADILRFLGKAL
jgi:hypothetical protein